MFGKFVGKVLSALAQIKQPSCRNILADQAYNAFSVFPEMMPWYELSQMQSRRRGAHPRKEASSSPFSRPL